MIKALLVWLTRLLSFRVDLDLRVQGTLDSDRFGRNWSTSYRSDFNNADQPRSLQSSMTSNRHGQL
jgi:hypothetical protein